MVKLLGWVFHLQDSVGFSNNLHSVGSSNCGTHSALAALHYLCASNVECKAAWVGVTPYETLLGLSAIFIELHLQT